MQIGLLGKANVGKSTFFSAATETDVASGNFPFTTIEPNVGVAYVQSDCACKHFDLKHDNELCINGTRLIPIKLIDVAGLVPGAHEGKGLGNQFLDDARQAEVLIHVVDIAGTTDIQGQSVAVGTHDPLEDVAFVQDEFDQWFIEILKREWDKITREVDQKRANIIKKIELNEKIIVGHLAPYVIEKNQVKLVIILRRNPYQLETVYKERNYSEEKIKENIGSEILGVITHDTMEKFEEKACQIDVSEKNIEQVVEKVLQVISKKENNEQVDWLDLVTKNNDLEKFFTH